MLFDLNKFLMLGDSITQFSFNSKPYLLNPHKKQTGYQFALGAALTTIYTRKLDIVQRGYAGYTSRQGKYILKKILKEDDEMPDSLKIKILYVFFGTNDASGGAQNVPLEEYRANMTEMANDLLAKGIKVILVTPTYHDADVWYSIHPKTPDNGPRSTATNKKYAKVVKEVGTALNVPVLDLFLAFDERYEKWGFDNPRKLLVDGIHFNGYGYLLFRRELMEIIKNKYPKLYADDMPMNLMEGKDIIKPENTEKLKDL